MLCRAAACRDHLLIPTSLGEGSPSVPIHARHPHKQHRKTHHVSPMLCSVPLTLLSIFRGSFPPPAIADIFLSCKTVQYLQKQSTQQRKGEWASGTSQMLLTFTLPFPITNSGGEGKGTEIKKGGSTGTFLITFHNLSSIGLRCEKHLSLILFRKQRS